MSVVFNELAIVSSEAQEASDIHTVFRLRPIHYCMGLMFLSMDAVHVNIKATVVDIQTSPGLCCMFGSETVFWQKCMHFSDMYNVFHQSMAVNHIIVKVYHDEFVFHWLQDAIHHVHEVAGCIQQAKWQDSPLVQTTRSCQGPLLPIGCCNPNLIEASHQGQFCELAGAVHGVE